MLQESVTVEHVIGILNDLVALDPEAMREIIESRVTCNEALAEHPTVQVGATEEVYRVGMLGILNGIFGTIEGGPKHGYGPITLAIDEEGNLHFRCTQ